MAGLIVARRALAMGSLDGLIFACGGASNVVTGVLLDSCEKYDPSTNKWSAGPAVTFPDFGFVFAVINGKLCRGSSRRPATDNSLECLADSNGQWQIQHQVLVNVPYRLSVVVL